MPKMRAFPKYKDNRKKKYQYIVTLCGSGSSGIVYRVMASSAKEAKENFPSGFIYSCVRRKD